MRKSHMFTWRQRENILSSVYRVRGSWEYSGMVTTNFTCDARVTTLRPWNSLAYSAAVEFFCPTKGRCSMKRGARVAVDGDEGNFRSSRTEILSAWHCLRLRCRAPRSLVFEPLPKLHGPARRRGVPRSPPRTCKSEIGEFTDA